MTFPEFNDKDTGLLKMLFCTMDAAKPKVDSRYTNEYKFKTKCIDFKEVAKDCSRKEPLLILYINDQPSYAILHYSIITKMYNIAHTNAPLINVLKNIADAVDDFYLISISHNEEKKIRDAVKYVVGAKYADGIIEKNVTVKTVNLS